MEYGKKVYVGNFWMMKKSRSLSKKEMRELREKDNLAPEVRKNLSRSALPYIHIENISGGWEMNIGIGMSMYGALDGLVTAPGGDRGWYVPGIEGLNAEAVIAGMFVDTTIVGDEEYQAAKYRVMREYIERTVHGKAQEEEKADEKE